MKYKAIFFDLDGTLTDPKEGIVNSIKYALDYYNYDYSNLDLSKFIGPPLRDSFNATIGQDKAELAVEKYRERFDAMGGLYENFVYKNVEIVLKELKEKGYRLFIASSKPQLFVERILKHFKLDEYFEFMGGGSMDSSRSEKTQVITYVLENAKLSPKDVLMVGDRKYDLNSAEELGMDVVGVLYGYGDYEELSSCKSVKLINDIKEILEIL